MALPQLIEGRLQIRQCLFRTAAVQAVAHQEHGVVAFGIVPAAFGVRLGEQRVVLGAEVRRQRLVNDLLNLVLVEAGEVAVVSHQTKAPLDLGQAAQHAHALFVEHPCDQGGIKRHALHGAYIEDRALLLCETAHAVVDEILDRGRHLDLVDHLRLNVAAVGQLFDELPLPEAADHLEDEERHAVRLLRDADAQLLREVLAAERVFEQLDCLTRAEARERNAPEVLEPAERRQVEARPRRRHQQQPVVLDGARHCQQEGMALLRRELQVVHDPDRGLLGRQRLHEVHDDGLQRITPERLGSDRRALMLQQRREGGHERRRDGEVGRE